MFRIGSIPAGDAILSLFITRIPGFSACLGRTFSWGRVEEQPPVRFLGNYNNSTPEILVECGADPNCLMYYTMASVPEIAYWEDFLGKGVDDNVLNSLLLFSAMECSIGHVEYLLSWGASVNFQSKFWGGYHQGWTALAYAAAYRKAEIVMFLLNNGADVLQSVWTKGEETTIPKLVDPWNPDLARMLAEIECQERIKRGTANGLSP